MLEYLKKYQPDLEKYIGFNTDECFGPAAWGTYHIEEDKFKPSNPYAATKAGQWCLEYSFAHAFKMPIVMVHSMNIFGERQHPEKFIPKTVRAILKGEPVILHGTPEIGFSSRCWIHAREVCNALLFLTEKGKPEETYNVVGEERDVYYLAERIAEIIGKKPTYKFVDFHSCRPGHDFRYALDLSLIHI